MTIKIEMTFCHYCHAYCPMDVELAGHVVYLVEIHADAGSIPTVICATDRIKPGVIAMHHSWGGIPGTDDDGRVREIGANTNRLIDNRHNTHRFTGMTLPSAIPVCITRTEEAL